MSLNSLEPLKPLQINKISQISIRVHDLKVAVPFYQGILGLNLLFQIPNMAFFECGGVQIVLGVPESPQYDHPSSVFYFHVENIEESFEQLVAQNVTVLGKPHKISEMNGVATWMAFFQDPDENVHAITSEVAM